MSHASNEDGHDNGAPKPVTPDPRTAADEIEADDPHKAEKLANIGKDDDVAEEAEQE